MPWADGWEARRHGVGVALGGAVVVAAAGLAWAPWVTAGAVLGLALLAVSVAWPVVVVGALLFLGPLDLSFLTGGFKGLFAAMGGLDMNGIRLVGVSAGLWLAILADPRQLRRIREPEVRWYAVFLAWVGLSVAWSGDALEGARLWFKLAWPLLIYLTVSGPDRTRDEVERLGRWILVGAVLIIALNPLFLVGGNYVLEEQGNLRVGGAGVHQNPFSFYLLVVVLVSLGRYATRGQLRYVALAVGAIAWMALTLTRITLLASFVALMGAGLYSALVRRAYRPLLAAVGAGALIGAALLPMVLARTFGGPVSVSELWGLAHDPVALYGRMNWQGRELFWGVLVASWAASPWLGLGLGSSSGILKAAFPPEAGTVAHNEYIRLGTDAGVLGIALFAVAMGMWLRRVVSAGRGADRAVQEVALPALAVLLAWGVISLTDNAFDYYAPFTQFAAFLVGACVVWARTDPAPPTGQEPEDPR